MRSLLLVTTLLGALMGVPIDSEKIREILAASQRDQQAEVTPKGSGGDDDIEKYLKRLGLESNPPRAEIEDTEVH
jgi:hypothetical protein